MRTWLPWVVVVAWACDHDRVEIYPAVPDVPEPVLDPVVPDMVPPVVVPPTPGIGQTENIALGGSPRTDVMALGVLSMLETHCAECHANGASLGGLGNVLEIPALIADGQIVPGSSGTSPLLARVRDGSMPPGEDRFLRMISGEIALLSRFIDELDGVSAAPCDALDFVSNDDVYAAMSVDIAAQPEVARPFIRYVGLTYASNAGACGPALERERLALFKQLNSVSTTPDIHVPRAIEENELVYRIDLRHYGWDRGIDLEDDGVVDFTDGWLAIVAGVGPYAVEFEGPAADAVKRETSALVPFLPVNALVHASAGGELYYALIGARKNVYETELSLGLDVWQALQDGNVQRAGFTDGSPRREAMVSRLEQVIFPGRYYWLLDDFSTDNSNFIFDELFDSDGIGQVIFHLPNGLQAYAVRDVNGHRQSALPGSCAPGPCYYPEQANAAACHGCHSAGLFPVTDQVLEALAENEEELVRDGTLTSEEVAGARAIFPSAEEFEQLVEHDNEIYLNALERTGIPRGSSDPVSRVFAQFEAEPLNLTRAAAELGVTAGAFRAKLASLDLGLVALGVPTGSIERAAFSEVFRDALCVFHADEVNHPVGCR